ncbi:MAG TPA: hypothetical protein PLL20_07735 [Phycisphaerae bacterium]|nr:hypothetical protein [Phycisphaerae bacterium]HRR85064.1 hypothetical protein [Phycisphaerae bacterium]
MSHLGRPEGKDRTADAKYTVKPCADRPCKPLKSVGDCLPCPAAAQGRRPGRGTTTSRAKPGDFLLL